MDKISANVKPISLLSFQDIKNPFRKFIFFKNLTNNPT